MIEAEADEPRVALDEAGNALIGWYRWGAGPDAGLAQVRSVGATGQLRPILDLGRTTTWPSERHFPRHHIALSPTGLGAIAWIAQGRQGTFEGSAVMARRVSATGVIGEPITVAPGVAARDLQAGADASGNVVLAWTVGDSERVQARTLRVDGTLGPVADVTGDGGVVRLAVDEGGNAILAWWRQRTETGHTRVLSSAGVLGPVRNLGSVPYAGLAVGVSGSGDGALVAEQVVRQHVRIFARRISTSGFVGRRRLLARGEGDNGAVAVDGRGRALVTWSREFKNRHALVARVVRRSGALGPLRTLVSGFNSVYPTVTVNSAGRGVVSWYRGNSRVSVRPVATTSAVGRSRTFGNAISPDALLTSAAVARDGTVMVVWLRQAGNGLVSVRGRL